MSDHPDAGHRGDTDLDVVGPDDPQEARSRFAARLDEIEALPLASRAEAFGEIHDELRAVLEGTAGDAGQAGR